MNPPPALKEMCAHKTFNQMVGISGAPNRNLQVEVEMIDDRSINDRSTQNDRSIEK